MCFQNGNGIYGGVKSHLELEREARRMNRVKRELERIQVKMKSNAKWKKDQKKETKKQTKTFNRGFLLLNLTVYDFTFMNLVSIHPHLLSTSKSRTLYLLIKDLF